MGLITSIDEWNVASDTYLQWEQRNQKELNSKQRG